MGPQSWRTAVWTIALGIGVWFVLPCHLQAEQPLVAPRPSIPERRAPLEAPWPLPPIAELIAQLDSPRFAERAEATLLLARARGNDVRPLAEAVRRGSDEQSTRALTALETVWLRSISRDDVETADLSQAAIYSLAMNSPFPWQGEEEFAQVTAALAKNPKLPVIAGQCQRILASQDRIIRSRAINRVRELGGYVKYREGIEEVADDGSLIPSIDRVVISTHWTGGESGLRHVRLLSPPKVYIIDGAKLPEGAIARLQPFLREEIQQRGPSYLGVQADPLVGNCRVSRVEPNTPASKAGILDNDTILEFNSVKVNTFEQLVVEIAKYQPGQVVPVLVERQGAPKELKVTMEEWN